MPSLARPSLSWRRALAAWLAEHKSYPDEARRNGAQGTVALRFTIDPAGRVLDVTLLRGSGSAILDDAATAMLRNATLPPPDLAGTDRLTIFVELHYRLTD